jgi:hypothetical protein
MKVGLKFNICGLETSHLRNDEVQDLPSHIEKSVPPRLSYACRFAWQHLQDQSPEGSSGIELSKGIEDFLHVRLLYQLEVMSLTKEIPTTLSSFYRSVDWGKFMYIPRNCRTHRSPQTSHTDLGEFTADAARFVVDFTTVISASSPHIYLSTLPWSTQKSKIAQHFLLQFLHRSAWEQIAIGQLLSISFWAHKPCQVLT